MLRRKIGRLLAVAALLLGGSAVAVVATPSPALAACNGVAGETRVYNFSNCNDTYGTVISTTPNGVCKNLHYPNYNPSRANNISSIMNLTSRTFYFYADSACQEHLFVLFPYTGASNLTGINNDNIESFYSHS